MAKQSMHNFGGEMETRRRVNNIKMDLAVRPSSSLGSRALETELFLLYNYVTIE